MITKLLRIGSVVGITTLALIASLAATFYSGMTSEAQASTPPNIVVIMVDDLDVASFNQLLAGKPPSPTLLPNIKNHLVDKGTTFTESFVADAACCPSRATFLTGQYPHNHGVYAIGGGNNGGYKAFHTNHPLTASRPTLAKWLQDGGYYTALAGKYLNDYGSTDPIPEFWDFWRGLAYPTVHWKTPLSYTIVRKGLNPPTSNPDIYQTRQIGDIAQVVIQNESITKPFFLLLTPTAPHVEGKGDDFSHHECNGIPPDDDVHPQYEEWVIADKSWSITTTKGYSTADYQFLSPYGCTYPNGCLASFDVPRGITIPSFNNLSGTPDLIAQRWDDLNCGNNLSALRRQHRERLTSMLSVDVMVGKVFGYLQAKGKLTNTLVIFTSDNGFMLGEHRVGNKLLAYEESIRVPLIIRLPGQTQSATITKTVVNIDLAPTILDYAGLQWASPSYNVDGRSLKPLLEPDPSAEFHWRQWFLTEGWHETGPGFTNFNTPTLWYAYPNYLAVRTATFVDAPNANWKNMTYMEYYDTAWPTAGQVYSAYSMYDMKTDPYQITNTYNLGAYAKQKLYLQWLLAALKNCAGSVCRSRDGIEGSDLYRVPKYGGNNTRPCWNKGLSCTFDTRTFVIQAAPGVTWESVTAYGKYWNYNTANNEISNTGWLTSVQRYITNTPQPGPCYPATVTCTFDTRTFAIQAAPGVTWESITANGKYWNYNIANGMISNTGGLTTVQRYITNTPQQGPCLGITGTCTFDTRTFVIQATPGVTWESITANRQYWNYNIANGMISNTGWLTDVARYALGPCQYALLGTKCKFDTRTFVVINGQKLESITAYGRYFHFDANGYPWP